MIAAASLEGAADAEEAEMHDDLAFDEHDLGDMALEQRDRTLAAGVVSTCVGAPRGVPGSTGANEATLPKLPPLVDDAALGG